MSSFRKATREQLNLRMALCGPTGSGKTYSALSIASGLGQRIAVIDTENRSASRFADRFQFEVCELDQFAPENYVRLIHEAENDFDVVIVDSLSHAWMGKGGVLDMVDKAGARQQGNNFAGWRTVTPKHNDLVDALIRCKAHLIVTMRSKMEYVLEKDERSGKTVPMKVGMAPIQRDGMEYEFDIVGDMDAENRLVITKSRCIELAGGVIDRPSKLLGEQLKAWAETGEVPARKSFEEFAAELSEFVGVGKAFEDKKAAWSEVLLEAGAEWTSETLKTCTEARVFDRIIESLKKRQPTAA